MTPETSALVARACFILTCWASIAFLTISHVILAPLRLLRSLLNPPPPAAEPARIRLNVHHAAHTSAEADDTPSPRDTLLFIHGFPDRPSLWQDSVDAATAAGFRCLVVALPASDGTRIQAAPATADIVAQLADAVSHHAPSVTVVSHDWGVVFARHLQRAHPRLVHRVVYLDVGRMRQGEVHWTELIAIWSYFIAFSVCFLVRERWIAHAFLRGLLERAQYICRPIEEVCAEMAWPYVTFIREVLHRALGMRRSGAGAGAGDTDSSAGTDTGTTNYTGASTGTTTTTNTGGGVTSGRGGGRVVVPTLFAYGRKKLLMFHGDRWLQRVLATPHGRVESFDADHWFMVHQVNKWTSLLLEWLDASHDAVPTIA